MINKKAQTNFNIETVFKERWSPRSFSSKTINDEDLQTLLEAARWAPSAFNEQPWRFLVGVKGTENYQKILSCLDEWNQKWAQAAPVLIIALAKKHFTKNDKDNGTAFYDLGQSVAYMCLQAQAMNIYSHQMAGISPDKINEQFNVPNGIVPLVGIALGYLGKVEELPEKYREAELSERKRKSQAEFVLEDFDKPYFG